MKVNKSSVQYRMVDSVFRRPNKNLCVYFWQCAWTWALTICVLIAAFSAIATPVSMYLVVVADDAAWYVISFLNIGIFVWLVIFSIIAAILITGLGYGINKLYKYMKKTRTHSYDKDDGMVVSYIKAKKQKICPRINFVDE